MDKLDSIENQFIMGIDAEKLDMIFNDDIILDKEYENIKDNIKQYGKFDHYIVKKFLSRHCHSFKCNPEFWIEYLPKLQKCNAETIKNFFINIIKYVRSLECIYTYIINDNFPITQDNIDIINRYFDKSEYLVVDNTFKFTKITNYVLLNITIYKKLHKSFYKYNDIVGNTDSIIADKNFSNLIVMMGLHKGKYGNTNIIEDAMSHTHFILNKNKICRMKLKIPKRENSEEISNIEIRMETLQIRQDYKEYYKNFDKITRHIAKVENISSRLTVKYFNDAMGLLKRLRYDDEDDQVLTHFKLIIYHDLLEFYYIRENKEIYDIRYNYNISLFDKYINPEFNENLTRENIDIFFDNFKGNINLKLKQLLLIKLYNMKLPFIYIEKQSNPIANLPENKNNINIDQSKLINESSGNINDKKSDNINYSGLINNLEHKIEQENQEEKKKDQDKMKANIEEIQKSIESREIRKLITKNGLVNVIITKHVNKTVNK